MTTITCLTCAKLSIRGDKQRALQGRGRCPHDEPLDHRAFDVGHECTNYVQATEEIATGRVVWWIGVQNQNQQQGAAA